MWRTRWAPLRGKHTPWAGHGQGCGSGRQRLSTYRPLLPNSIQKCDRLTELCTRCAPLVTQLGLPVNSAYRFCPELPPPPQKQTLVNFEAAADFAVTYRAVRCRQTGCNMRLCCASKLINFSLKHQNLVFGEAAAAEVRSGCSWCARGLRVFFTSQESRRISEGTLNSQVFKRSLVLRSLHVRERKSSGFTFFGDDGTKN